MDKADYRTYFKGKKITMLGLGLLGRGVNVAKFLADLGAEITITDMKDAKALAPSLKQLKKYKNIRYVLMGHKLEDFRGRDMVIKAAGVALDSSYIAEAKKNKIPVEMDASLFAKFTPVTIVGVTGTRGKSTVTHLLAHVLERAYPKHVFVGGNVRGMATLPLLKKTKIGDIVILELDSWQLQGFGDAKLSPHVAVFTNFLDDHMNYYRGDTNKYFEDKANIFKYQDEEGTLVVGEQAARKVESQKLKVKSQILIAKKNIVPKNWKIKIPGEHNRANIACAIIACRELGVSEQDIKRGVESFTGVPGRLEIVATVCGVRYVNDTTATTPDGLRAALETMTKQNFLKKKLNGRAGKKRKNIVLIAGGADKGLDLADIVRRIHRTVKALVLIKGTATDKILAHLNFAEQNVGELSAIPEKRAYPFVVVNSMREAVREARGYARRGDTILLSPGAASFGVFKNEFDRGDQFVKLVKKIHE